MPTYAHSRFSKADSARDAKGVIQRISEAMEQFLVWVVVVQILEYRGSKTKKSAVSNDQILTVPHDFHVPRSVGDRFAGICP